jgi:hypothetical protein
MQGSRDSARNLFARVRWHHRNPSSAVRQRKTLLSTIASFYLIIQLMIAAP